MDISGLTSAYTDFFTNTADNTKVNALKDTLSSDYSKATDEELMDACKQFEAYFLEQMFKSMAATVPKNEETTAYTSNLMDYYTDEMMQKLATDTTENNSLGLAQTLYEQMKRNYDL